MTGRRGEEEAGGASRLRARLTREQRELHRFRNMLQKDDFIYLEDVKGSLVNILAGLELHVGVFSTVE
ncbi:oxidoreductase, 2OG-Fe(II) oxygenase family protein-like [Hordeum vulgare]|nr:oxidoreductase, 2OG-Fe(II) oxygenase family protein-like [Hordeum vulgare]